MISKKWATLLSFGILFSFCNSTTFASAEKNAKEVYFNAWAGNEKINDYIRIQSEIFEKKTGIKVIHVKVGETQSIIKKVQAEKAGKNFDNGSVDVMWVNGENFAALKKDKLIFGPIDKKIENYKFLNKNDSNFKFDFGVAIDGYEIPWGKAQFVFIWDKALTSFPPQTALEFLDFAKKNKGKLSYVKPPQFYGTTFLKQILLDLTPDVKVFQKSCDTVKLEEVSAPLWTYLDTLHPLLWRNGKTFPLSEQKMHQMLLDKELMMSISFNPLESDSLIQKKELPPTAVSVTFKKGGIGNVHFLSIPFNSPHKDSALLWINHLLSAEAQLAKADIKNWGDPSVLDLSSLSEADREKFPTQSAKGPLLSEPNSCWVSYLETQWLKRYGSGN